MESIPFISIIIVNHNGRQWLKECFESLEQLDYPKDRFEVLLGDNASTDDSVSWTEKNFPWVRILRLEKNYGFCKPNNRCAEAARGDYLVLLNNDTFVARDWLKNFVQGALSEPDVRLCTCKILFPHLGDGKILNAAGGVIFPIGSGIDEGWMQEDGPEYSHQKYTAYGCGAGIMVEKRFFLETGGLDEYYFFSGEDMDLGMRTWLAGYKVLYVPTAVMYHYMGRTGFKGKGITPTIVFLAIRNNLYFMLKNFEFDTIIQGLILFNLRAVYRILYSLFYANFRVPVMILKAYAAILKDLNPILKKRRLVQASRKISDKELSRRGLLVSASEFLQRNFLATGKIRHYHAGSLYDKKDKVTIQVDENGHWIFVPAPQ